MRALRVSVTLVYGWNHHFMGHLGLHLAFQLRRVVSRIRGDLRRNGESLAGLT